MPDRVICEVSTIVRAGIPVHLADELSELVKLRSNAFPDDVAIATCRILM